MLARDLLFRVAGDTDRDLYELDLVQVVIRHGDRAPLHSIPNYVIPDIPCKATPELIQVAPFYEEFAKRLSNKQVGNTADEYKCAFTVPNTVQTQPRCN